MNLLRKCMSTILATCLTCCILFPSYVTALVVPSMEQQAFDKAEQLRSIIQNDVPYCTWSSETICSKVTALYSPDFQVNGYIFEYNTASKATGYIQINTVLGYPILDSYALDGTHWAVEKKQANDKLIRLSSFSYCTETSDKRVALIENDAKKLNFSAAKIIYNDYVATLQSNELKKTNNIKSIYTQTVFAKGYSGGLTLATHTNTGDDGSGCYRIAAVNCCLYWAKCREKTGLYVSNSQTYSAMASYIPLMLGSSAMHTATYDGLKNYMTNRGYSPTIRGTISPDNGKWKWGSLTDLINRGIPPILNLNENIYHEGQLYKVGHAVLMLGYQHIDVVNTLIVADGRSSTYTYLSTEIYLPREQYSYYNGW